MSRFFIIENQMYDANEIAHCWIQNNEYIKFKLKSGETTYTEFKNSKDRDKAYAELIKLFKPVEIK